MESEERKNREEKFGLLPLNSASSEIFPAASARKTDDSGQALDLVPQPQWFSYRSDFGGQQRQAVAFGLALANICKPRGAKGVPLSLERPKLFGIRARLLMVSAPLLRPSQCRRRFAQLSMSDYESGLTRGTFAGANRGFR
jgi:hypothetical protein